MGQSGGSVRVPQSYTGPLVLMLEQEGTGAREWHPGSQSDHWIQPSFIGGHQSHHYISLPSLKSAEKATTPKVVGKGQTGTWFAAGGPSHMSTG